jgi:hypothetical protein
MIRKYRRGRRLRRRVRRVYKRKVHRTIGSGASDKRYFKLRFVDNITTDATGNATSLYPDLPSTSSDWTNVVNLFSIVGQML